MTKDSYEKAMISYCELEEENLRLIAEVKRLELDFNCRLEQIRNHCDSPFFQLGTIRDMTRTLRATVSGREKCFWPTGCANSERCSKAGQCIARWQNANKDKLFGLAADDSNHECPYCSQEMDAPICSHRDGPMTCTRQPGHSGRHIACGAHHGIGSWPSDTADSRGK